MTIGSWKKVKSLFFAASELRPEDRSVFLRRLQDSDEAVNTAVRDEVRQMLQGQEEAGSFMADGLFAADETDVPLDSPLATKDVQFSRGDMIADRYRVTRYIARGGMGEVYEAEDLDLGILIAIKAIRPNVIANEDMLSRFKREIDLARRVTHPNIGRIYDFGRHRAASGQEIPFLTMELLLGETVAERIKRAGVFAAEEAFEIVQDIAAALEAIHRCGIVHRDFKSSNVMLIEQNYRITARVMDFGLARPTIGDGTLTQTGQIGGTPPYMAPEQFDNVATPATDFYALGIVMHEMLLGVRPRSREIHQPAAMVHTLPGNWAAVIKKCVALDPADRFQSAEDLLGALETKPAVPVTQKPKIWFTPARRAAFILTGAIAITLVAGLGWWLSRGGLLVHAAPRRIAVLPIHTDSKDPLDVAFCDGFSNTLRSDLAELETSEPALWIVPSSEVRDVHTSRAASLQTGANLVIDATLYRNSRGLLLNTELVDARSNRVLLSRQLQVDDADALRTREFPLLAGMLGLQVAPQALSQIAQTTSKDPGAFDYYEQGLGYLDRADLIGADLAIDLFTNSLSRDPNFALAYAGLGQAYGRKYLTTQDPQWIGKALDNGRKALSLNNKTAQVHLTMADIYEMTGANNDAIREARRSLEIEPGCSWCLFVLGKAYVNGRRLDEAAKTFQTILDLHRGDWKGFAGLAWVEEKRGHLPQSAKLFHEVTALAPDNAHALADLGGVYVEMAQYEPAIAVLRQAIQIRPQDEAYSNLGSALIFEKRYPEAAEAMERAAYLAPENHDYWRNVGDSYRLIPGQTAKAESAYRMALEKAKLQLAVKPGNAELASCIGLYYAHLGQTRQSRKFSEDALRKSPDDREVLFTAAISSELSRNPVGAVKYLDAAFRANYPLSEIEGEPELLPLHSDVRYQNWISKARLSLKSLQSNP